jgi:hypothetical protein
MGICNGFQILVETGLLPGVLLRNKYLEFICKNVFVKINNKDNSSRRGLMILVSKRRRLLKYLQKRNINDYTSLIKALKIKALNKFTRTLSNLLNRFNLYKLRSKATNIQIALKMINKNLYLSENIKVSNFK